VTYTYPIFFDYKNLQAKVLKEINIENINRWIADPEVRINLLNNLLLTIVGTYFPPGNNPLEYVSIFDSPFMNDYMAYIEGTLLPVYIREMDVNNIGINSKEGDTLRLLVKASLGYLPESKKDYLLILRGLFPNTTINQQPAIGNCYFCSIGENLGISAEQVRADVSNYIKKMKRIDSEDFVSNALQNCPENSQYKQNYLANKDNFVDEYPNLILRSCEMGDRDCQNCIWGGNYIDPIVSVLYNIPILSVAVGSGDGILKTQEYTFTSDELSESVLEAARLLDMIDITDEDMYDEEGEFIGMEQIETLTVSTQQMFVSMQYTVPFESRSDEEVRNYLNGYAGPFISYITYLGAAHIDAINFGQNIIV
jgi:hypothetical protein